MRSHQNLFSKEYYHYLKEAMIKVFDGVVDRMNNSGKMKKSQEAKELMKRMVDEPIEMFDIFQALEESKEEGIEIGENRGIKIGENRGIEIGENRGIKIGEDRGIKIMKYLMKNFSESDSDETITADIIGKFGLSEEVAERYVVAFRE